MWGGVTVGWHENNVGCLPHACHPQWEVLGGGVNSKADTSQLRRGHPGSGVTFTHPGPKHYSWLCPVTSPKPQNEVSGSGLQGHVWLTHHGPDSGKSAPCRCQSDPAHSLTSLLLASLPGQGPLSAGPVRPAVPLTGAVTKPPRPRSGPEGVAFAGPAAPSSLRTLPSTAPGSRSEPGAQSCVLMLQILFRAKDLDPEPGSHVVRGNQTQSALLAGLRKFTLYELQVLAFTRIGNGVPSVPLVLERTKDDGMYTSARPCRSPGWR